jgi:hypothetical protein
MSVLLLIGIKPVGYIQSFNDLDKLGILYR